jgi:tetratricopeptide (TPR) repeat protein
MMGLVLHKPDSLMSNTAKNLQQAVTAHRLGDLARAASLYRDILAVDPNHVEAMQLLGVAARQMGKPVLALQLIERALTLNPKHPNALANKALLLREQQDFAGALECVHAALAVDQKNLEAASNLGGILFSTGDYVAAATAYRDGLKYHPQHAELHQGLALCLLKLGDLPAAHNAIKLALAYHPDAAYIHNTHGNILRSAGHYDEAITAFQRASSIDPNMTDAVISMAMIKLVQGDFAGGFALYEQRSVHEPRYEQIPYWCGDDLGEKTLLLRVEQGFGDTLQFIRYVPQLVLKAKNLLIEVQAEVLELCRPLSPAGRWVTSQQPLPAVDCQIRLLDLPQLFGANLSNIPAAVPYLQADPVRQKIWQEKTANRMTPRIGLVWAGNPKHLNDLNRSVPLALLHPLLEKFAAHLVLLQKGFDTAELQQKYPSLYDGGNACGDFGDTAALVATLDLVITVDTAVAHLAGALGKPVWLLLPCDPDWRWLLGRADSPWYPSMRLFRQHKPRDWQSVIQQVQEALHQLQQGDHSALSAPTGAADMPQPVALSS